MCIRDSVRAPEGVEGLGVVAHGHDVARFPGEEPHQPGLNAVGVLILVHHDVAVAFPEPLGKPFAPRLGIAFKQILKLEQQVVVVEQDVYKRQLLPFPKPASVARAHPLISQGFSLVGRRRGGPFQERQ